MHIRLVACAVALTTLLSGDTLTLKSGRIVEGTYLGGDSRQVRIAVGDRVDTFPVADVTQIRFGTAPVRAAGTPVAPAAAPKKERADLMRPSTTAAAPTRTAGASRSSIEIPAGATIVVSMIDDVDSERDTVGQTFRASVDEAVSVDGQVVVPRGSDVTLKLIEDRQSGRLSGRTELTLDLVTLAVGGRTVDVLSEGVKTAGESRTSQTGKVVGGTAALGAIIGAIAGGGKGAAIGAVTGAGAGAAVQVMTKGPRVRIPSETRLTFTLQQGVRL